MPRAKTSFYADLLKIDAQIKRKSACKKAYSIVSARVHVHVKRLIV